MVNQKRVVCGIAGTICGLVLALSAQPARADEVWVTPTYQQDIGGLGIASNTFWPVTPVGVVRLAWAIPNNLQTFQSAKVALIPHAAAGSSALNIFVCPAQNGDAVAAACAGPFAQSFTGAANQLVEVEIGSLIASRIGTAGTNYVAVLAYTTPTTSTDHIVGLRFTYAPKAPAGAATLNANTFSGTQTAPAFVGNGSGLTNLPIPSGAATLNANTFSGTQTAPAFVGNGSGLTNLPFPAGAATLGANTFTGTQTINPGNLALTDSTATSGNILKNGTLFLHNSGSNNTFLGANAGNLTMTGLANTAVGDSALSANTTGQGNVASGYHALQSNSTGFFNTASGYATLQNNAGGSNNTASGFNALTGSTGNANVAVGYRAGDNATTGDFNIYLGANVHGAAGESNTMYLGQHGVQTRTFIGGVRGVTTTNADALPVVIDSAGQMGTAPVAVATLGANTFTGTQTAPAFVGDGSGLTNLPLPPGVATLGSNTFLGTQFAPAFVGNGSGLTNLPVPPGVATLSANTFTATQTIHTGNLDLDQSTATAGNITKSGTLFAHNFGTDNTFVGLNAGNTLTSGLGENVAIGAQALRANTSGIANTASGFQALRNNTSGGLNTATGWLTLGSVMTASQNTGHGAYALSQDTTGATNTALGYNALSSNTTGSSNLALGAGAGINGTTGSNNIYLGSVAGTAGEANTMYLGLFGTQTKTFIAGVRGITTVNANAVPVVIDSAGQLGTISSSIRFKEDVHDMAGASARLLKLRPVTFRYTQAFADGVKPVQYGLIAEEVADVFPELAVRGADGRVETVHYETLNVLLVNEVQKQQQRIEALEKKIDALLAQLAK